MSRSWRWEKQKGGKRRGLGIGSNRWSNYRVCKKGNSHDCSKHHHNRVPLLPTSLNLVIIPSIHITHTQACVGGFAKMKGRVEFHIWAAVVCAEHIWDRRGAQCQEKHKPPEFTDTWGGLGFKHII